MTSLRKRKRLAQKQGLTVPQLELVELVEELLEAHRWLQVLGYASQFALTRKLGLSAAERDEIIAAATRAVEKDAQRARWRERLARVRAELERAETALRAELPRRGARPAAAARPAAE